MPAPARGPNRLAAETSPYLLQHATNPVDWYPFGPEALERARRETKPIFLSIGYSACHWCHVMERESFENERAAELLNRFFVCIKVDREERPDLDEIYMKAVIALSGSGGWPMSVFLTPELEPFYGGTYFPPYSVYGRPGFIDLVARLAQAWQERPDSLRKEGARLTEQIAREARLDGRGELPPDVLDRSLEALSQSYDPVWGGFGDAPKFPHATDLRLLLRHGLRTGRREVTEMAARSLAHMAAGGIHDQLGSGFARYSTDEEWLVPHFEKMLYDNALLIPAYLEAWLATGDEEHARVARSTCEWALREMRTAGGGFASSQDADSEGEEGRFFVWTPAELEQVLGARTGRRVAEWFGVTPEGNFEGGASVLTRRRPAAELAARWRVPVDELEPEMEAASARLFEARASRVRPGTDDKVLASWNGLMISAMAQAAQVLEEPRYADAARAAARFVLGAMRRPDGRLLATARAGRAHANATLDDHVFLIQGLVDLYETDFDGAWLAAARELEALVARHFEDSERGGFFTTSDDHEALIVRLKSLHDGALPAGNGVHALNLLRLAELTGERELALRAQRTIVSMGALVGRYPQAFSALCLAIDFLGQGPREVVLAGEPGTPALAGMLRAVRRSFRPQRVVALAHAGADEVLLPLLVDRSAPPGGARAWVCRNWACGLPSETPDELISALGEP